MRGARGVNLKLPAGQARRQFSVRNERMSFPTRRSSCQAECGAAWESVAVSNFVSDKWRGERMPSLARVEEFES